jgi:2-polyprenyl-3-methyl-5-hydroxy-6-metoxy-1,4-benzoquinol methylase
MDEYQRVDLLSLRSAPKYRAYLADICSPYVAHQNVIEIGAGLGDFGRQLLQHKPVGLTLVEPGAECFIELEQMALPGVRVLNEFSRNVAAREEGSFDTALYSNVLEHIEDDTAELRTALRLLKRGGHLLVIVPAHQFLFSPIDQKLLHYRRYNRRSFLSLVSQATGFEVVECRYLNKLGVGGWLFNKWCGRTHQSPWLFAVFDRYFLPVSRMLDRVAPGSFGLSLFVVLRKVA